MYIHIYIYIYIYIYIKICLGCSSILIIKKICENINTHTTNISKEKKLKSKK